MAPNPKPATGLHILTPESLDPKERIGIYGVPGVGKTSFSFSVPEKWGGIVYVPFDDNGETLRVVPKDARSRVLAVAKPKGENVLQLLDQVAATKWSKEFPGAGVLIIDTLTVAAIRALMYVANKGFFSGNSGDKHVVFGEPGKGSQAIPLPADYGAVQNTMRSFFDQLFSTNDDLHILVLFHQRFAQDKEKNYIGGPATVGNAMLEELPSLFDTVIRLERKNKQVKDAKGAVSTKSVVVARTDHHGYWIGKIRENGGKGNPIPVVELDSTGRNFWPQYLEVVGG